MLQDGRLRLSMQTIGMYTSKNVNVFSFWNLSADNYFIDE